MFTNRKFNKDQLRAIALYGIDTGTVVIQPNPDSLRSEEIVKIFNDFFGAIERNKEFAEYWEKVRDL